MSKRTVLFLTCALFLAFAGLQGFAQSTPHQAGSQAASTASQAKDDAAQATADPDNKAKVQRNWRELSAQLDLTNEQQKKLETRSAGQAQTAQGCT